MNVRVTGKSLRVNTEGTFDTAGSPPPKKSPVRRKKPPKK